MNEKLSRRDAIIGFLWTVFLSSSLVAVGGLVRLYELIDWDEVWRTLGHRPGIRLLVLVGFLAISKLFLMRDAWPRLYGVLEIYIGMSVISLAVVTSSHSTNFERLLKIATGLYLMVRGHDNRINGYKRLMSTKSGSKT
jgi:hypothetical protein